ncbi:MAG TPA: isoprenylcysteine carboxylmethyltransferase family protein [Pyrinomonadaceae bacterium]
MLLLKTLLHVLLLPCTLIVWAPLLLVGGWRGAVSGARGGAPAVIGAALIVCGLAVFVWCHRDFLTKGRGTPNPLDPPKFLVARGPYRWVRNPMYVCAILMLFGEALIFRSPAFLLYALVVLLGFHLFVMLYEEPTLRRLFGASYEDYCRTVPRWLPRRPAHHSKPAPPPAASVL